MSILALIFSSHSPVSYPQAELGPGLLGSQIQPAVHYLRFHAVHGGCFQTGGPQSLSGTLPTPMDVDLFQGHPPSMLVGSLAKILLASAIFFSPATWHSGIGIPECDYTFRIVGFDSFDSSDLPFPITFELKKHLPANTSAGLYVFSESSSPQVLFETPAASPPLLSISILCDVMDLQLMCLHMPSFQTRGTVGKLSLESRMPDTCCNYG